MGIFETRRFHEVVTRFRKSLNILPQHVVPYSSTLIRWVIVGYIIRVALVSLVPNSDILSLMRVSFIMKERHQLIPTAYPEPITYLLAFLYRVFDPFLSKGVFNDYYTNTAYTPDVLSAPFRLAEPGLLMYLFVTKMPFLLFDLLLSVMLLHLFKDGKQSLLAFKLWIINPISIYISYAIGQYDIIPVFFIVLSLYFIQNKKPKMTMLSLGIAVAFKTFALLFFLPIILFFAKEFKGFKEKITKSLLLIVISLLPILVSKIAVFFTPVYYLPTNVASSQLDINGFFGNTLYWLGKPGQPFLSGLLFFSLDYSIGFKTFALFHDVIYVFPLIYSLLLLALIYYKKISFKTLWKSILAFLLMYYASSLFHQQWFLYAQPLLILLVIDDFKFLKAYAILIPLYFIYVIYWSPHAVAFIETLGLPSVQFINIFRSIFSGVCIFIVVLMVLPENILQKIRGR